MPVASTVPRKAVPADSHEVSTWCSWQRSQVHLFRVRCIKPGKNGGKMEFWRRRWCSDMWQRQWTWMIFQDFTRRKSGRKKKKCLLCVNFWGLSFFILNVSVAAVKLLHVSVVMRNCCEIHPLAPNPLPKLCTSILNRFWVSKSELATLWQAVVWRETSSSGWWLLPSVLRWQLCEGTCCSPFPLNVALVD